MLNAEDLNIDRSDIMTMAIIDLGPDLPEYVERSKHYLHDMMNMTFPPDVLMIQGVRCDTPSILSDVSRCGYQIHDTTSDTGLVHRNTTAIHEHLEFDHSENLEMSMVGRDGRSHHIAPDCLIDVIKHHGWTIRLYNYESLDGPFYEHHRSHLSSLIINDAYLHQRKDPEYLHGLMYLGGDLHADDTHDSVRLLLGRSIQQGCDPSAWIDVWPILHSDDHMDGSTERQTSVLDSSVKIPQLVRARRNTFFMAYGDVLGRAGSPITIDLNGNTTTDEGIPYSNDYGLTMDVWIPPFNRFTTNDDEEE